MSRMRERAEHGGREPGEIEDRRGLRDRLSLGRSRRSSIRREGPPPTAELLSDRLQSECDTLRSALEVSLARVPHRVIMMTSAIPEEGCTTLMSALGFNLTVRGSARVLLVDANLRRPALHQVFGIPTDSGLSHVLAGRTEVAMAVTATPFLGLSVMPLGGENFLPAQVFGSEGVTNVLSVLKEHYDYVLVDTPALLSVPEGAILGGDVDGVILVARAGRTKRETLTKANNLLRQSESNILGVVLNRRRYVIPSLIYRRL